MTKTQTVNIDGLLLKNISAMTDRDVFATSNEHIELINQNGNLRLKIKNTGYVSKTRVELEKHFNIRILRKVNETYMERNFENNQWRRYFKETDLNEILNGIDWSGLSPVLQLLRDINLYESEIKLTTGRKI